MNDDLLDRLQGVLNALYDGNSMTTMADPYACIYEAIEEIKQLRGFDAEIIDLRKRLEAIKRVSNGDWAINAKLSMEEIAGLSTR